MGKGSGGFFSGTAGGIGSHGKNGESETGIVAPYARKIHKGRQEKHIFGSRNYKEGRSIFYGTIEDAQELVDEYAGTGTMVNDSKERVDFGRVIGKYVDIRTGTSAETTNGLLHYSKDGVHIVPAKP